MSTAVPPTGGDNVIQLGPLHCLPSVATTLQYFLGVDAVGEAQAIFNVWNWHGHLGLWADVRLHRNRHARGMSGKLVSGTRTFRWRFNERQQAVHLKVTVPRRQWLRRYTLVFVRGDTEWYAWTITDIRPAPRVKRVR